MTKEDKFSSYLSIDPFTARPLREHFTLSTYWGAFALKRHPAKAHDIIFFRCPDVMRLLVCFILLTWLSLSCSKKVFNPYDENFGCPEGFKGDCSSVQTAYKKSIAESERFSPLVTVGKDTAATVSPTPPEGIARISDEVLTPEISAVKKYQVFIPGYIDNNNVFYGKRKIYYFIDKPKWVIKGAGVE